MGSGKKRFEHGVCISNEPWFNLTKQQYQPCVPSAFEHEFNEAFHGGSSLRFTGDLSKQRLLVCNFACEKHVIVAVAIKRSAPEITVQMVLSLSDGAEKSNTLVYCGIGSKPSTLAETDTVRFVEQLDRTRVDEIVKGLADRSEATLQLADEERKTGWQVCYFNVGTSGAQASNARIVDVAVSVEKMTEKWQESDFVLLGALQFHAGL